MGYYREPPEVYKYFCEWVFTKSKDISNYYSQQ
jgi:hypothetical protein